MDSRIHSAHDPKSDFVHPNAGVGWSVVRMTGDEDPDVDFDEYPIGDYDREEVHSELADEHRALKNDIQSLVDKWRRKAAVELRATRWGEQASDCADELEELIE